MRKAEGRNAATALRGENNMIKSKHTQRTMPKLFCSKCGARATAACNCQVGYIAARVYAEQALKARPEKSNRAIAAETGISYETIRKVREATDNKLSVRIGLDGKMRRVPRHLVPWTSELTPSETAALPAAEQLIDQIGPTVTALRKASAIRLSPNKVAELVYDLLTRVFKSGLGQSTKARACEMCAQEWPTDRKPTKQEIDAIEKTAQAWSDLHKRLADALADKDKAQASNGVDKLMEAAE
jgi:hypothetical protein